MRLRHSFRSSPVGPSERVDTVRLARRRGASDTAEHGTKGRARNERKGRRNRRLDALARNVVYRASAADGVAPVALRRACLACHLQFHCETPPASRMKIQNVLSSGILRGTALERFVVPVVLGRYGLRICRG